MNRLATVARGVGSALLLLAILLGVPAVLVRVGAYPSSVPDPASLWRAATGSDPSGRAAFVVLAGLVWLAWATFTLSVLRESAAAVRSHGLRPARPLPGLGWSAGPAAALIGAIVTMLVAAPVLTATAAHAAAVAPDHPPIAAGGSDARTVATATHHPGPAGVQADPSLAVAHPDSTAASTNPHPVAVPESQGVSKDDPGSEDDPAAGRVRYTVTRRDTLWSIAEHHLGDPLRYREIAALNPRLGPDYQIRPGQVLTLPTPQHATPPDPAGHQAVQVSVEKGDTLTGVAHQHGVRDWHTVWAVNAGRAEPGGKRFTNPDHIEVGWALTVPVPPANPPTTAPAAPRIPTSPPATPSAARAVTAAPAPESRHGPPAQQPPATTTDEQPPQDGAANPAPSLAEPVPAPAAGASPSSGSGSVPSASNPDAGQQPVAAVVGRFAAGGGVLAAGVLAAVALARRQRLRDRRPGHTVAAAGPSVVPIERASVTIGGPAAAELARVDEVLRRLAATDIEPLQLAVVALTAGDITARLAAPAVLPRPWRPGDTDGLVWTFPAAAAAAAAGGDPDQVGAIAPYPTLLHVGSDPTSSWLVNLERTGALVLTGDRRRCLDLARVMAAQLGVNPWSGPVNVTLLGFGQELLDAAPARLRYAAPAEADTVLAAAATAAARTADFADQHQVTVLEGRRRAVADETWAPSVLLIDGDTLPDGQGGTGEGALTRLVDLVCTRAGATATAIVLITAHPDTIADSGATTVAHVDAHGSLTLPEMGVSVTGCGWDEDTARGVGMLLAHARTAGQVKIPDAAGQQPWQAFADAAGALREQYVQPRTTRDVHDSAKPATTCTLPLADQVYLDAAATTRADLANLAPNVPAQLRPQVEGADPDLDADVAAWFDPASARAKLILLGPLTLRTHRPASERPAFYAELTAYLATRVHGASADQVATAFNLAAGSARAYLSTLRELLGDHPDTGTPYLPHADKSTAAKTRGVNIYQLDGLLVDADLFRRLRLRGQARGQAGIEDYVTALRLVTGEPFSQMRDGGGAWLLDGDRHDQHLTHAIVDVAHLVTAHALAAGDTASARAAVDIARLAAPYEETPRLDAAAVDAADGHTDLARRGLTDGVCNRTDDGQPPPQLNPRTKQILAHHRDWLSHAS